MIISLEAEKALMTKVLERAGIQRTYLNIIKAIYSKPTGNIKLNEEKTESDSTKIRNKTRL